MRLVTTVFACLALLGPSNFLVVAANDPQTRLSISDLYAHSLDVDFAADQKLRLDLRSGDVRVVGQDAQRISIHVSGRRAENARDMTAAFKHFGNHAELRIYGGGSNNEVQITIEVPKSSDLYVRMPFGNLTLDGVSGNKDVELHAGDLDIAVGTAAEYGHVDASVISGDLEASPFGESKSGLFRSFEKRGSGRYRLHAHLGAGDLVLR
jgi:hypothetical protein